MSTVETPSMWSKEVPGLQLVWDKTSLKALQFCPTRYDLEIRQGYRKSSSDLVFGMYFAGAQDVFFKALLNGASKEEAQFDTVKWALENSGEYEQLVDPRNSIDGDDVSQWKPWGGHYEEKWRCEGTEKYKNEKGNAAKCPYSHKGKWFDGPAPSVCGVCGSATASETKWVPFDPHKNRETLIRIVVWYTEEFPGMDAPNGLKPYVFPNGTPGAELQFAFPLPWTTDEGERFVLAGYIDALKAYQDEVFIGETKTTKSTIGKMFFGSYNPSLDVSVYDYAVNLLYPDLHVSGVAIEGIQTMIGGARFGLDIVRRSDAQREEFHRELGYWLKQAEQYAKSGHYPRAEANCWMCPFKDICRLDPNARKASLAMSYDRVEWNPLKER